MRRPGVSNTLSCCAKQRRRRAASLLRSRVRRRRGKNLLKKEKNLHHACPPPQPLAVRECINPDVGYIPRAHALRSAISNGMEWPPSFSCARCSSLLCFHQDTRVRKWYFITVFPPCSFWNKPQLKQVVSNLWRQGCCSRDTLAAHPLWRRVTHVVLCPTISHPNPVNQWPL